ncbi:MAG: QueT transporter family protein [Acholeplasmataceae bacterium]|nr:QueT transporter family protein [Acholeplasmataceae bacterium]
MNKMILKDFILQTMIAAIYVVLVYVFQFASFGLIQFRIAEVLMILVFFDKKSVLGLTVGCFLANLLGGALPFDVIFGTLATTLAAIMMILTKKMLWLALLMPAIINGIIVGIMLTYVYDLGFLYITIPAVFLGEFAVLFLIGLPLYKALEHNQHFNELFEKNKMIP